MPEGMLFTDYIPCLQQFALSLQACRVKPTVLMGFEVPLQREVATC